MRLLRHGASGAEKPGLLDAEGRIRDLSGTVDDITPEVLAPERLAPARRASRPRALPLVEGSQRLGRRSRACPI